MSVSPLSPQTPPLPSAKMEGIGHTFQHLSQSCSRMSTIWKACENNKVIDDERFTRVKRLTDVVILMDEAMHASQATSENEKKNVQKAIQTLKNILTLKDTFKPESTSKPEETLKLKLEEIARDFENVKNLLEKTGSTLVALGKEMATKERSALKLFAKKVDKTDANKLAEVNTVLKQNAQGQNLQELVAKLIQIQEAIQCAHSKILGQLKNQATALTQNQIDAITLEAGEIRRLLADLVKLPPALEQAHAELRKNGQAMIRVGEVLIKLTVEPTFLERLLSYAPPAGLKSLRSLKVDLPKEQKNMESQINRLPKFALQIRTIFEQLNEPIATYEGVKLNSKPCHSFQWQSVNDMVRKHMSDTALLIAKLAPIAQGVRTGEAQLRDKTHTLHELVHLITFDK